MVRRAYWETRREYQSAYIYVFSSGSFLNVVISDQKPLSVEVGKASMLRLLGAEQENAELKRLLEELQAQQEVRALMSS